MSNEIPEVEKSTDEAKNAASTGAESQSSGQLPTPEYGFDQSGEYFVLRIHLKYGHIYILGFLEKAKDFLKFQVAKQAQEMQQKSLIKPGVNKGFGRFNLFKK